MAEFLRSAIVNVLPHLSQQQLESLVGMLNGIGVEEPEHLRYVKEDELKDCGLSVIKARMLVDAWRKNKGTNETVYNFSMNCGFALQACLSVSLSTSTQLFLEIMTDFLRTAITKVLPHLGVQITGRLICKLEALGVQERNDLCYVRDVDLLDCGLTTITARTLVDVWKTYGGDNESYFKFDCCFVYVNIFFDNLIAFRPKAVFFGNYD